MPLPIVVGISGELWGGILVMTLWSLVFTAASTYGGARTAEHGNPGKLACIVAVAHLGTFVVGLLVFLVVLFRLRPQIEKKMKRRQARR